ncbi:MAG: hypothetical protein JXM79_07820 [Sedimentisphaerales bacterium]|nr:hypothetical protein [Sedimentisphaerales bacterium]
MRLKVGFTKVHLYRIAVAALVWMVSGCAPKSLLFPSYMQPSLLYLKDQPHSRLYVEVDTVEGVEVPDQWLDELKAFLGKHCSKLDGIKIIKDAPIPLLFVKGMPIGAANLLCLDGPPVIGFQPVYLHIFFYDNHVGLKAEKSTPHIFGFCPSGIFFNVSSFKNSSDKEEELALMHQVGHILGLCQNRKHGDGHHCDHQACLMTKNPGYHLESASQQGSGVENLLCADCRKDLETLKTQTPDPNLVFKGPFLIRREEGYSVASLPYCDMIMSSSEEMKLYWPAFLLSLKREACFDAQISGVIIESARDRQWDLRWHTRGFWDPLYFKDKSSKSAIEGVTAFLEKATHDPCPHVKEYAIIALKQLKKEQKK